MTPRPSLPVSSERLLQDVSRKNSAFLVALALLSALSFIIIIVLLVFSYDAQGKQTQTLKTQQELIDQLNSHAKERSDQINELQDHINCIVTLFTLPNRANYTITDIKGCQLSANGTVITPNQNGGTNAPANTTEGSASPQASSGPVANPTPTPASPSTSGLQKAFQSVNNVISNLLGHL